MEIIIIKYKNNNKIIGFFIIIKFEKKFFLIKNQNIKIKHIIKDSTSAIKILINRAKGINKDKIITNFSEVDKCLSNVKVFLLIN